MLTFIKMPDVLVDDGLLTHPKLATLAEGLEVTPVNAVGHLVSLWGWVAHRYPDGDLSGISHAAIALASAWHGPSEQLFKALTDAGFLDNSTAATEIHDWAKHTGRIVARRAYDANRKRVIRAADPAKAKAESDKYRKSVADRAVADRAGKPTNALLDKAWHDALHEIDHYPECVDPDSCWRLHEWLEREKYEGYASLETAKDMRDQLAYDGKKKTWFYEAQGKRKGNYLGLHRVFRSWIKRRRKDEAERAKGRGRPDVPPESAFESRDPWDA